MPDLQNIDIEKEFEKNFRQYFYKVVHYSYSYVNDYEKARNIAQDVYYQLWKIRDGVNFNESPLPLLLIMAKRLSLNMLRKEKNWNSYFSYKTKKDTVQQFNIDALKDTSATLIYTSEVQKLFKKGLEKMSEPVKEVFLMSRDKGLKYREIADAMNISQKTVENRITIALRILRTVFKDYLPFLAGCFLFELFTYYR